MGEHHHHPEQRPGRYERIEIVPRPLIIGMIGLVIVAIIVHVLLYLLFGVYERRQAAVDRADAPTAIKDARQEPPANVPRLQGIPGYHEPTPREDLAQMRQRDQKQLSSYGRRQDGSIHIPIERAMDLALERGIFPHQATTQPTTQPRGAQTRASF